MRHVLSALVQNVPGVLSHISGMLASRGYNIDSLAVGETEDPHLSRMVFVVVGDDAVLEQVRKQLEKIVTVVRVDDVSSQDFVERDLMLIKVAATARPPERRSANWPTFSAAGSSTSGPKWSRSKSPARKRKIEAFVETDATFWNHRVGPHRAASPWSAAAIPRSSRSVVVSNHGRTHVQA